MDSLSQERRRLVLMTISLSFDYRVPRQGNGLTVIVPNLKEFNYTLHTISFKAPTPVGGPVVGVGERLEMEATLTHGGNAMKYLRTFFQIFDRINLADYWYRLADGDRVELNLKNQSTRDFELPVTFYYEPSHGILLNSSTYPGRELRNSTLLTDLASAGMVTRLHLKSLGVIRTVTFTPNYRLGSNETDLLEDIRTALTPREVVVNVDATEAVLDFSAEDDLRRIRPYLAYYQMQVQFDDPEKTVYVLAYGFK